MSDHPANRLRQRVARHFPSIRIGAFIGILHLLIGLLGAGVITAFSLYFIYRSGEQANLRMAENLAFTTENVLEDPYRVYQSGVGTPGLVEMSLNRSLKNHPGVRYAILRLDGSRFPASSTLRSLPGETLTAPEVQTALANSLGQSVRRDEQGRPTIFVATTINHGVETYGVLVLAVPFNDAMGATYQTMRWMAVIALLIVAFTVAEGLIGSIYISRPITRLSAVAEQLSRGDLSARAQQRGPLEVVHLAATLNVMAARLQTSLESLRAFVANASHELRTPLTSIKLQVDALRSGALEEPEVAQRFLDQVESEIDRLVYTVNDMLDLSHIEGNPMPAFQPVNLNDLASEVLAFWETRARQAGLSLLLDSEAGLPDVKGDPFQLRRLVDNLIDNAIKHTPSGGQIRIMLRRCQEDAGPRRDCARVEVQDTGCGIAAEHLPHLFERFYRVDPRPDGSGLGLAIAHSIVTAHGGTIGVDSQPGVGSTFWVELPAG